ncbi:DUF1295 domain containing protein [Blastocystis sp. ATCC 50177/Nand II]|uniref:DUF1295 domain containing protein n=1 Tax=Blastocystis sp. subtype 1 (strain ATCC 50177 / NandII) TaxID=478820 RepID=A0A196SCR0_BLAHN|nr:DUF1295 domain containing protein [Blastocystis sp. ATCC 50177/Nand II]
MPDLAFEKDCTIGSSIAAFVLILIPYWVAPYLIAAGYTTAPSYPVMAFCVLLHTLGVAVMMVSDAQKYYTLQHKKQLITDGMYRYIRSPNYLGEVMIYSSYALLANHWLPWLILLYVWSSVFATRIITKEKRMERYPEWKSYKARTNCIVPIKFFMHFFQKAKDDVLATFMDNFVTILPFVLLGLSIYHLISYLSGEEGRAFREECHRKHEEVQKQLKKRMSECCEESQKTSGVTETRKAFYIDIEMPGVKKEDIKVETDDNELTVSAVRHPRPVEEEEEEPAQTEQPEQAKQAKQAKQAELPVKEYKKKYVFPESADMTSIMAKYEDGVLSLYIQKKEEFTKAKRNITIE